MSDLLNSFIRALLNCAMSFWMFVAWRCRKSIGPPNSRCTEDYITFRSIIDCSGVFPGFFILYMNISFCQKQLGCTLEAAQRQS